MRPLEWNTLPLSGTVIIEANAGTGKTHTLCLLYLRLLIEKGLDVSKILVVTYTEAAAAELRLRIRHALQRQLEDLQSNTDDSSRPVFQSSLSRDEIKALLAKSVRRMDEAAIFTIHALCHRLLLENAFESSMLFDFRLSTDTRETFRGLAVDFWRKRLYDKSPFLLTHLQENRCAPECLVKIVEQIAGKPGCLRNPEPPPGNLESTAIAGFSKLKEAWPDARARIKAVLEKQFRKPKPARLFEGLDGFLRREIHQTHLPEPADMADFGKIDEPFFQECTTLRHCMDRFVHAVKSNWMDFALHHLPTMKNTRGILFFDDLLLEVHRVLSDPLSPLAQKVQKRYPAILVDEVQDTDPVQSRILNTIHGQPQPERCMVLIGDPKQSIYSFRNADIHAYLTARGNAESVLGLQTNYRASPGLVTAVNALFARHPRPFGMPEIQYHPSSASSPAGPGAESPQPMRILFWQHPAATCAKPLNKEAASAIAAKLAAAEITALLAGTESGGDKILAGDIAVLVRTNRQSLLVEDIFRGFGIPVVRAGTQNMMDAPQAEEMRRLLCAVLEPYPTSHLRAALTTPGWGFTANHLAELDSSETGWEEWIVRFRQYREEWESGGFLKMFRSWLAREGIKQRLHAFADGNRRIANLLHLSEILSQAETEESLHMHDLLHWLEAHMEPDAPREKRYEEREDDDCDGVRVVTIHRSKGLEFPVVFCPFAWDAKDAGSPRDFLFHDPRPPHQTFIDLSVTPSRDNRSAAMQESFCEELRLLYVAVTRAKQRCYLMWGPFRGANRSALGFLLHGRPDNGSADSPAVAMDESSSDSITGDLKSLCREAQGAISVHWMKTTPAPESLHWQNRTAASPEEGSCRFFRGSMRKDGVITSFTSVSAHRPHSGELPDHDTPVSLPDTFDSREAPPHDLAHFPKGPLTGRFFHEVLEKIDFRERVTHAEKGMIAEKLQQFDLPSRWLEPLSVYLENLRNHPLALVDGNHLLLSEILPHHQLCELEFHYPLHGFALQRMNRICRDHGVSDLLPPQATPSRVPVNGFMKGFVDLVFQWNGKVYLLDWKSNFLGPSAGDYHPERIEGAMRDGAYRLQYLLYSIALHRYLQLRFSGYDCERHFGGALYVFLRGIPPQSHCGQAVFFDRPSRALLESLCREFTPTLNGEAG